VRIDSISFTYAKLTNASPSVLVGGVEQTGTAFTPTSSEHYGMTYEVNATTVRIQNRFTGTVNHWSVLTLFELTIHYTVL